MKKILKVQQLPDSPFHLTWIINNICTNSCSYCPAILHNGTNHHYDWANAKRFFEILFQKHPKIHCTIAGGEPTVSPFFSELVDIFYDAGHTIGVTSNGSRTVRFWKEISPKLNYVCFSYHAEFPDAEFIEKVLATEEHTPVTVRVMMHPNKWDQCVSVFTELSKNNYIHVEPVRIIDWKGVNRTAHIYSDDQTAWLANTPRSKLRIDRFKGQDRYPKIIPWFYLEDSTIDKDPNAVEYVNAGLTNFYGYSCEAGLKELFINWKGEIYRGNCLIDDDIGNINNPEHIMWPDQPIVCNKNLCHCSSDININKWCLND
jgi:organic radical activating enzyme